MNRYWLESTTQLAARLMADYRAAKKTLVSRRAEVKAARERFKDCVAAQSLVQDAAQAVQQQAHDRIAGVVTRCLAAVFRNPYTFHIVFEKKRGKTEAVLEFRRDGMKLRPSDGVGGSVLDVAAFALRLACLGLQRPKRRKIVFIDEGFRGLSSRRGNKERVKELLEVLAKELGFQIVLVTHDKGLVAGKVVKIKTEE